MSAARKKRGQPPSPPPALRAYTYMYGRLKLKRIIIQFHKITQDSLNFFPS